VLVVYTTDRFSRDKYDSAIYKRKLKDYGVQIRYAAENKIDIGNVVFIGHSREMQKADGINTAITYYKHWIDKDNALDMLDRFFSVSEE
jgi:hypothetical protein